MQNNVFGEPLELCGLDPVTGYFRDGYTTTDESDYGSHTVCAVVSAEFLEHQKSVGNDLSTPAPQMHAGNRLLRMAQPAEWFWLQLMKPHSNI